MNKWWGYQHVNGSLQVKRFFDARDLVDAMDSDFVVKVIQVFDATDRADALEKLAAKLGRGQG